MPMKGSVPVRRQACRDTPRLPHCRGGVVMTTFENDLAGGTGCRPIEFALNHTSTVNVARWRGVSVVAAGGALLSIGGAKG